MNGLGTCDRILSGTKQPQLVAGNHKFKLPGVFLEPH